MSRVTRILAAIERGDIRAVDELFPLVYQELRHLAARRLNKEFPGQTLQATALVHEAYLRLVGAENQNWGNHHHFLLPRPKPCAVSSSITLGENVDVDETTELHLKRALKIRSLRKLAGQRRVEHENLVVIARLSNRLGILYYGQGCYDEAQRLFCFVLEVCREFGGEQHPATLKSMFSWPQCT